MTQKRGRYTGPAKKRIKNALIELLRTTRFDHVTVTAICRQAHTSRITFYTYFADKYTLLDEYFKSMGNTVLKTLSSMQQANNKNGDPIQSWCNFLDAVLGLNTEYGDVVSRFETNGDPYLYSCFHRKILYSIEQFTKRYCTTLKPKYSVEQTSRLLCDSIWGFVDESRSLHIPETEIRREAEDSLRIMLCSRLFTK
jgi:AcrR family transcriptional regulator